MPAELIGEEHGTDGQPGILGADRRQGDAGHLHAESEHENQVQKDVRQVDRQKHEERRARVLGTEKPADQRIVEQRAGGAPDTDVVVLEGDRPDGRVRADQLDRENAERSMHEQQAEGHRERDAGGLPERGS